jgi:uncharacterized protein YbjT (DUF2867 family)
MKILIVGASQGTGALTVREACARGHEVTAFARNPQKLDFAHEKLTPLRGDFHDAQSVSAAVRGNDAVIVTASATSLRVFKEDPQYFSRGTRHVLDAMKEHGVKRLVILSALGTGESRKLVNFFVDKLLVGFLLKVPFEDHQRQEELVKASGLDWVIARPGRLTNGPAHKKYVAHAALAPVPFAISRADLADFLVRAATEDSWVRKAVQIGG